VSETDCAEETAHVRDLASEDFKGRQSALGKASTGEGQEGCLKRVALLKMLSSDYRERAVAKLF